MLWKRLEVVEALIAAGADIDGASISGITALSAAVSSHNVPIVKRLLAAGANARGTTCHELTVLHMAAQLQDREMALTMATLLIDAGADPHVPAAQIDDLSPLELAEEYAGHRGFAGELMARGVLRGFW